MSQQEYSDHLTVTSHHYLMISILIIMETKPLKIVKCFTYLTSVLWLSSPLAIPLQTTYHIRSNWHESEVKFLSVVRLFATPWTVAYLFHPWDSPGKNTGVGYHIRTVKFMSLELTTFLYSSPGWCLVNTSDAYGK